MSAASVTARISSEPMPLKRAARAAPLPSHATHAAPVWSRIAWVRSDVTISSSPLAIHIEGNVEAANSQRRATQGVNRRSMARETGGGMAVRAALMRSTYFCRPSRSAAIIEFV